MPGQMDKGMVDAEIKELISSMSSYIIHTNLHVFLNLSVQTMLYAPGKKFFF